MRVYLDTCILSEGALPSGRLLAQMGSLVSAASYGGVEFVTSPYARLELQRIENEERRALALVLAGLLPRVMSHSFRTEPIPYFKYMGAFAPARRIIPTVPELLTRLSTVFDEQDAKHIYQATQAECDVFLTDDHRTILNRVRKNPDAVNELCGVMAFWTIDELREHLERTQTRHLLDDQIS
jgi:hypothetical protein